MRKLAIAVLAGALFQCAAGGLGFAQDSGQDPAPAPVASSQDARKAEEKAAWEAATAAATNGPADVPFLTEAVLHLPPGYAFIPIGPSNRLLRAWGNSEGGEGFLGTIFPTGNEDNWFITAYFIGAGYVKDEEAKNWDTDALLKATKDGVEAGNTDRAARGFEKLKVDGWIEKPVYDATQHRLVYSIGLSALDAQSGGESGVNFHTYALGRDGYVSLDLVTGSNSIERFKDRASTVLAALDYKPGKRYEEFVASTDRVAEYGIAALVAGIAAKKLGLLALGGLAIAKFGGALVAFAKPLGVAAIALVASIGRFFRRRPK